MTIPSQIMARDVSEAFQKTISPWVPTPPPTHEPDELLFLEIVSAFHTGDTLPAAVPRTETSYNSNLRWYIKIITSVMSIWTATMPFHRADIVAARVDPAMLRFLYELFDVNIQYPFLNMLYRIARNVKTVIGNPTPRFQNIFLKDLPAEIIYMIASWADYSTLLALTQTNKAYRRIAVKRSYEKCFFSLRYRNWVLHGPASASDDTLHLDVLDAVESSVAQMVDVISAFLNCEEAVRHVRYISIDHEWARMWPRFIRCDRHLPRPGTSDAYAPMYRAIISLLCATRVRHIRFISISLTRRVLDHIAVHPTLRALTLERYGAMLPIPNFFTPGASMLNNIEFLRLLLDLEVTVHRRHWGVLTLLPNIRQVHAYSDRYAMTGFRFPMYPTASASVMRIEYLHLQGCTGDLEALILWLAAYPSRHSRPGALRRLKLHSISPISHDDAFWLVSVLGAHHPNLRVFVLEGVVRVQPYLFAHIQDTLKLIESLTVITRANKSQLHNKLCMWDRPGYEYADAIRGCWTLRHLEVNMLWAVDSPSPRVLDDLIAADAERCVYDGTSTPECGQVLACDGRECYAAHDGEDGRGAFHDGYSIALPFLECLPWLMAFAIRADETVYSCSIGAGRMCWIPEIINERSGPHQALAEINPFGDATWNCGLD